ncbi:hypothetical protein [Massilia sp. IC2-476]|uniref:hypothetical protein n=1 Tax=Massilia sp. IC2-476 TaxID=2887199 RepID=UPI001D12CA17|nr:hypothetical protein [Massilia sp. IC2-476]MCC2971002.1 hypothetical protein [Massilia sp. IC2-476]
MPSDTVHLLPVTSPASQGAMSRAASGFLLFAFFWIVAAAAFSGFAGKWGLRDGDPRFGVAAMLEMEAHKPFVYRQLVPDLARRLDAVASDRLKERVAKRFRPDETFAKSQPGTTDSARFRYAIVWYASFLSLLGSLFVLRRILLHFNVSPLAAVLAPTAFALAFPYLQTVGGYFYDTAELLFASLAFLLALRGRLVALAALVLVATLNKETFFFVLPALYPLLRRHQSRRNAWLAVGVLVLFAGLMNVALKAAYLEAFGGALEFHLLANIQAYLSGNPYFRLETTYGLVGPSRAFVGTLAVLGIVLWRAWPLAPRVVRRHLAISALVNLPLFLAFCATGELRNLSTTFTGLVLLVAFLIDREASLRMSMRDSTAAAEEHPAPQETRQA